MFFGQRVLVFKSRAQIVTLSRDNSFIFAIPACGKAGVDGQAVRLNIVALTDAGLGKGNIECKIQAPYTLGLSVRAIQAITDTYGKALFDIYSDHQGIYEIKVFCDDTLINDQQKVCFE